MGSTEGSMTEGAQALDLAALAALEAAATPGPWITHDEDGVAYIGAPATGAHLVDYGVDVEQRHRDAAFIAAFRNAAPALIAAARAATADAPSLWRDAAARWRERAERAEAECDAAQAALARVEALHWSFRGYRLAANGAVAEEYDACDACDDSHPCATIRALRGEGQEAESHEAKRARRDDAFRALTEASEALEDDEPPQLTRRQMREAREHHDPGTSIGPDVWGDAR